MFDFLNALSEYEEIKLVGSTDKVKLSNGALVYRQRLYFYDLDLMLKILYNSYFMVEVPENFYVSINNIISCKDILKYLYNYASEKNLTIDKFLRNSCLVHLHDYLDSLGLLNIAYPSLHQVYNNNIGFLDRAPFLLSRYNKESKTNSDYSIFYLNEYQDNRKFSTYITSKNILSKYGFSNTLIIKDMLNFRFRNQNYAKHIKPKRTK